jgi:hypothetical protein
MSIPRSRDGRSRRRMYMRIHIAFVHGRGMPTRQTAPITPNRSRRSLRSPADLAGAC